MLPWSSAERYTMQFPVTLRLPLFIALLGWIALESFVAAKPSIHKSVPAELEKGVDGVLMVSFEPPVVKGAYNPNVVLKALKRWKMIGCDMTLRQFVNSGAYADKRGDYVFAMVQRKHAETRALLDTLIPSDAIRSSIPIANLFLIRNLPGVYDALKNLDSVQEISTNLQFEVPKEPLSVTGLKAVASPIQWNIEKIGAPTVWRKGLKKRSRGQGITIGIADSGVFYTHPLLQANYRGNLVDKHGNVTGFQHNYNWWDGVREPVVGAEQSICPVAGRVPCDDDGHGTHCTSTAGGLDGYGVAPEARWIGCRNMQSGFGSTVTYLQCLNFFLAPHDLNGKNPKPSLRPHVISNSYNCPEEEGCSLHSMTAAVKILRAAGVFMSVAAGNNGPGCSTISYPPAFEPQVITVGAVDFQDRLASFSSRGPVIVDGKVTQKPDIVAPGVQITGAVLDDQIATYSGTSMATPHVAGAVALILSNCPCLKGDVSKVQAFLQKTAVKLYPESYLLMGNATYCGGDSETSYPNNYFGYGRIDVAAAVKSCMKYCFK